MEEPRPFQVVAESSPLDDRGRFTVHPKWRKMLGKRVYQVLMPDGSLLLIPARKLSAEQKRLLGSARSASGDDAALDEVE